MSLYLLPSILSGIAKRNIDLASLDLGFSAVKSSPKRALYLSNKVSFVAMAFKTAFI